jgi:hypothetical protein
MIGPSKTIGMCVTESRPPVRRTLVLLALAALLAGCNFGLGQPGITMGNYNRIHKGMTMAEVKAVLGPPRSSMYTEGDTTFEDPHPGQPDVTPGRRYHWQWFTQDRPLESLHIWVDFEGGSVIDSGASRSKIDPT